jgi:hypothetical protein
MTDFAGAINLRSASVALAKEATLTFSNAADPDFVHSVKSIKSSANTDGLRPGSVTRRPNAAVHYPLPVKEHQCVRFY